MRKRIYIVLLVMLPLWVVAAERSVAEAAQLAAEYMNHQRVTQSPQRSATLSVSSYILAHTRAKINSDVPAFYVFNRINHEGFIVVSADDQTEDILMYSEEGSIDVDHTNPNLQFWLNHLQEEISAANEENCIDKSMAHRASVVTAIGPLLKKNDEEIKWDQGEPYYNNCPKKDSALCLTGCVATATAQIMCMWGYPVQGTGSHSYLWNQKTLTKDFSKVVFDWDNMLAKYTTSATAAQKEAVAELMYCCGVACNMDYDPNGSGAWTDDMGYGLITYFGYTFDRFISAYSKADYTKMKKMPDIPCAFGVNIAQFTDYFNSDLESGRPIILGGEDSSGGHEFVCDGRNTDGYFHINWGWSGQSNCYCLLSALKPSGTSYRFSTHIDALIGLRPAKEVAVTGVCVSPASATLKINEAITLSTTISPITATNKQVSWSCDNLRVVAVSSSGVVTGVGAGTAHVIATTIDGEYSASATITVTNEVVDTIINVRGVTVDQHTASMKVGETIQLYHNLIPDTATNTNVVWMTNNKNVATVDANGKVAAVGVGTASVSVTTIDGNYTDMCVVMVTNSGVIPEDTTYVMASEAKCIGLELEAGNSTTQFYGVKGYVTGTTTDQYNGFYIDDACSSQFTFQGFNCTMPSGCIVLTQGMYVCVYGYIMNDNNQKIQIKDGEVVLMDTIEEIEEIPINDKQEGHKMLLNGHMLILRDGMWYDVLGNCVK